MTSSQYSPLEPWDGPTLGGRENAALYSGANRNSHNHHHSSQLQQQQQIRQLPSNQYVFSPLNQSDSNAPHVSECKTLKEALTEAPTEENARVSQKMQKIARDMLAIKEYDLCVIVPRHISQDYDELFIVPGLPSTNNLPSHLLLLPRDTNYLVDVFFEHAHFYYPIVNRAIVELHLMEPQTPQALFLLNIIFTIACMHLARASDIKRAIQFRERAKEVQFFIDDKTRMSRIQALILGSMAVYGVFKSFSTFAGLCGAHRALTTTPSISDEARGNFDEFPDLQEQSQSIQVKKNFIPEAAYQARLWIFWAFYIRDCMARLYFGWPLGTDSMVITSDLPRIEGHVGLGGNESRVDLQNRMDEYRQTPLVIGKRRGSTFKRNSNSKSEKRHMAHSLEDRSSSTAKASNRANYRDTIPSIDDDDDVEGEGESVGEKRSGSENSAFRDDDDVVGQDRDERVSVPLSLSPSGSQTGGSNFTQGANFAPFSVLSPKILEQQSQRGYSQSLPFVAQPQGHRSGGSDQHELNVHMKRMKILIDAEEDPTDGGSFARILFLEEVRLWALGRRVGLYLAGRSNITAPSACPAPSTKGSTYRAMHEAPGLPPAETPSIDHLLPGAQNASQWSEEAWLQDHELQSLQAELIAWEEALPRHLKFRQDVDNAEVNQKVNGKMSTLTMSYYTITIMLQSSYLPIAQYNSSRKASSRSSSTQPSDRADSKQGGMEAAKKATSVPVASSSNPLSSPIAPTPISAHMSTATGTDGTNYSQSQGQTTPQPEKNPHRHVYFNTAHQICTELSNVILHHVELMLDKYPDWCSIQAKVNHALTAALRVSCLNAKLSSNSDPAREEAKAGFKMGSDLYKRLALLPYPLVIRSWPKEEDVQQMLEIEKEFREMMMTQDEQQAALPSASNSDETVAAAEPTDTNVSETMVSNSIIASDAAEQHIFGLIEEDYKFDFDQSLIEH
ncbi:hypothetical protein BGX26_012682 [Mortierella sp. AD094]|nr:hypothetical protein BGX26_012682 [Mortierella sp. AD094]